jgi:hypothetical protein
MFRLSSPPQTTLLALAGAVALAAGVLVAPPTSHADGPRWRPHPWTDPSERGVGSDCPSDMVRVHGSFCPEVEQSCLEWSDDGRARCIRFANPTRCLTRERVSLAFCMDRYEWPNREGVHPDVMVTFDEADSLCRGRGKRLCTEREWTFACEGERMLPYPYGYDRDPYACTIDRWARAPERTLLHNPMTAMEEVARVYEASASGTMPRCRSPFGAMDLTGNVDEWVVNETGWPYASSLMGGFWGRVRTRCRAVTRGHGTNFRYYQIGFRCCDDEGERPGPDRGIVATSP